MVLTKLYWLSRFRALIVPGDSDWLDGWRACRAGGEMTVGRDGRGLLMPDTGSEMDNSSSWIADDILPALLTGVEQFAMRWNIG